MQMVKGGFSYMIKYTGFSGLIVGGSMLIQAYRNKTTVFDYTASGAMAGGLLRMHHGMANLAVGAVAGGIFATVFGIVRYIELSSLDQTYEALRKKSLEEKIILRE
jgi:hypothetical protein